MYRRIQRITRMTFSLLALVAVLAVAALAAKFSLGWLMRLRPQPAAQPTASAVATGSPLLETGEPTGTALPSGTPTPAPFGPLTLTFAVPEGQAAGMRALAEEFHALNPGITVEVVPAEKLIANDYENAVARLTGGADAALFAVGPGDAASGRLVDLAPYIAATPEFAPEDYLPGALQAFQQGGGIYGLPQSIAVTLVLYDRAAFEQANIVPPPQLSGWSRENLLEMARLLTQERSSGKRYGFVDASGQALRGLFGPTLYKAAAAGQFNTPEVAAALRWYTDLALVEKVAPAYSGEGRWEQHRALVDAGEAAMWSDALYNYQYYTKQGRRLGLALFPGEAGPAALAASSAAFISASSAHPQAAWLWLAFLSRQPANSGLADAAVGLPPRRSLIESSDYWQQFDDWALPTAQYAADHLVFPPLDPALGVPWQAADEALTGASVEQALVRVQQAYDEAQAQPVGPTPTPLPVSAEKPPAGQAARILFWNSSLPTDQLYQQIEQFQAQHPEIQVDVLEFWRHDVDQPDCFASGPTIPAENARDLLPLLDGDPALKAQFDPQMLQAAQALSPTGQLLSLPVQASPLMMRYNKALFDAAGVAYPQPDWTLDDFLAAAQALTRQTEAGMQYGYVTQQGEEIDLAAFAAALGAPFWDAAGRPLFDTAEARQALQWYSDLALKHGVTPPYLPPQPGTPGPGSSESNLALIRSGRAAMWSEFYPYNALLGQPLAEDGLGWAPWPRGVQRATDIYYEGYSIAPGTQQAGACWQWITYLSGAAGAIDGLPARLDVRSAPEYLRMEGGWGHAAEDLPLVATVVAEYTDTYTFHHQEPGGRPWLDELLALVFGGTPLDAALAQIQQQALAGMAP